MDGEGTFSINQRVSKYSNGDPNYNYTPTISVINTDLSTIKYIMELWGLNKYHSYIREKDHPWNNTYKVYLNALVNCQNVLTQLNPFLVTKREQGQLLLQFVLSRLKNMKGSSIPQRTPYSEFEYSTYLKLRELNYRGSKKRIPFTEYQFMRDIGNYSTEESIVSPEEVYL